LTTYLINCSKCKTIPYEDRWSSPQAISFHKELGQYRAQLLELNPQITLDWEKTLPAWELYRGSRSRLYSRVTIENWTKPCTSVWILSALFGWVKHTDLLPNYDLRMTDKIADNDLRVYKFWRQADCLSQLITSDHIDLLSKDYLRALSAKDLNLLIPDRNFTDRGVQKGDWLQQQLNNIYCY
jgi:cytoplasmic iron level regulating protein YaaA (DUF328/UPF0246 family)